MDWVHTVLFLAPTIGALSRIVPSVSLLQCLCSWLLLGASHGVSLLLLLDTYHITPLVPEDGRQILNLLLGTSSTMLRLRREGDAAPEDVARLTLGAPGMGDLGLATKAALRPAPEKLCGKAESIGPNPITTRGYVRLLRMINFWQTICVTSLIISVLSRPFSSWADVAYYLLAWAAWPIMLLRIMPLVIRRLTVRNCVGARADKALIRSVTLDAKEAMLQYHVRLMQMQNFANAAKKAADTARRYNMIRPASAGAKYQEGLRIFDRMTSRQRHGIHHVYESWDANNDGEVSSEEMSANFVHLVGDQGAALRLCKAMVSVVDHDGTGNLTWEKFRALMALAAYNRPPSELEEALHAVFAVVDKDGDGTASIEEITAWLAKFSGGICEGDVNSLVFKYYGDVRYELSKSEFVDFMMHIGERCHHGDYGHGGGGHH